MNLWWSWSREARGSFAHRSTTRLWHLTRHNPLELLCRGGPGAPRGLRQRQRLPPPLRRGDGAAGATGRPAATPGSRKPIPSSTAGRSRTSAPSSASTTRCRSTPAASACSRATTARPRATSACRWSGVGLFYMKGYFDQRLRLDGWQEDSDEEFDISLTPLEPVTGRQARSRGSPWSRRRAARCTCGPGG